MEKDESIVQQKKQSLKREVLYTIYNEGQITIPQLADHTQFSIPLLAEIIDDLIAEKWISSKGIDAGSKTGRKPKLYCIRKDTHCILVFEIDIFFIRIALLNLNNEIISESKRNIFLKNDPKTIDYLIEESEKILQENNIKSKSLLGVGMSITGLVNPFEKISDRYRNFTGPALVNKFSERFKVPVLIDNDLKAMIQGEHTFGQLKGIDHALVVNIDYGVGVGMVLNEEVYRGTSGFSGELGHIPVNPDGDICYCGKRGCLETVVSATKIIDRAKICFSQGSNILKDIVNNDSTKISVENIIKAAEAGDEKIIDLLSDTGYELGRGLAMVVHLLNPQRIVISGSIARAGRFILHPVEEALNKYCMSAIRNDVTIEISDLGDNSKILGMQSMVVKKVLTNIK